MMRPRGYQMRRGFSTRTASALIIIAIFWASTAAIYESVGSHDEIPAGVLGVYPVTVNITVVDNVGRAIEGAHVSVVGSATVYPASDRNGTVLITDLYGNDTAPGTSYNFTAIRAGYTETIRQQWLLANQSYNLTMILNGATVFGIVQTSNNAVIGANVTATSKTPPTASFHTLTDASGGYQFVGIQGGYYDISAYMDGFLEQIAYDVNLTAGLATRQDFNLTPQSGSISGYITTTSNEPLAGANVSVTIGGVTITRQTNETGFYNQTGLLEGTYSVTASMPGFTSNTTLGVVVIRGLDTKNVNMTLEHKSNRLYGVVKAGTLLLPGVNVSIEGTEFYSISNFEGSFQIANITSGVYNISASLSGYYTNTSQITIPPGSDFLLLINLLQKPGAQLLVKVTATDSNSPLVGVLVTISFKGGDPLTQTTNIDGKFAFTGLTPGNYTVQLVKEGYQPLEYKGIAISAEENKTLTVQMQPLREGGIGFIFGFDMAHSMMILALFLTIVILAMAVWLRIKTFQAPENAPAVYDEAPEEGTETAGEKEHPAEEAMRRLAGNESKPQNGDRKERKENEKQ